MLWCAVLNGLVSCVLARFPPLPQRCCRALNGVSNRHSCLDCIVGGLYCSLTIGHRASGMGGQLLTIGHRASGMSGQLLCRGRNNNVRVQQYLCAVCLWAAGAILHWIILVLLCVASFVFPRTYGSGC